METVNRFKSKRGNQRLPERMKNLNQLYEGDVLNRIAIPSLQGVDFIKVEDILYLEAAGNYTDLVSASSEKIVASKALKHFDGILKSNPKFFRPHRSFIVNIDRIKKLSTYQGDILVMENEDEIPVSRYKKKEFQTLLGLSNF